MKSTKSPAAPFAALELQPFLITTVDARVDILREGDRPCALVMWLDGFAVTSKATVGGKRQTMAIHIPGDLPDLVSLHLGEVDGDCLLANVCSPKTSDFNHILFSSDLEQPVSALVQSTRRSGD